jgi:hypothetical protein
MPLNRENTKKDFLEVQKQHDKTIRDVEDKLARESKASKTPPSNKKPRQN